MAAKKIGARIANLFKLSRLLNDADENDDGRCTIMLTPGLRDL